MSRFRTLERIVVEEMAKPYQYGVADCFFFGCRVADAFDPSREMVKTYSGSYRTLMGAQKALRKRGYKTLTELFRKHLTPCAPAQAGLGDIVILQLADGEHVGICAGTHYITKTERGGSNHNLSAVKAAFRT